MWIFGKRKGKRRTSGKKCYVCKQRTPLKDSVICGYCMKNNLTMRRG